MGMVAAVRAVLLSVLGELSCGLEFSGAPANGALEDPGGERPSAAPSGAGTRVITAINIMSRRLTLRPGGDVRNWQQLLDGRDPAVEAPRHPFGTKS